MSYYGLIEEESMFDSNAEGWHEIARDERREKLILARKMLSMSRRLNGLFPDVATLNRELALDMWSFSKKLRKEYRGETQESKAPNRLHRNGLEGVRAP